MQAAVVMAYRETVIRGGIMCDFDLKNIADPEYFAENRIPAHSDHMYYESEEAASSGVSAFRHSLGGVWKFAWSRNVKTAITDFMGAE